MELGITPIESAYEAIGLHHAYLLIKFLFQESAWGMIAFGIGFMAALSAYLRSKDFYQMSGFMLLSAMILLVFIIPTTSIGSLSSTMEERGGLDSIRAQSIFDKSSKGREAPAALMFISRCYNSIIIGSINALNLAVNEDNYNYLKSPFLANKVILQMHRFLHTEIKDK